MIFDHYNSGILVVVHGGTINYNGDMDNSMGRMRQATIVLYLLLKHQSFITAPQELVGYKHD